MPFDPTLPLASSPVTSAELREQFNGLKELHDLLGTQLTALEEQVSLAQDQISNLSNAVDNVNSLIDAAIATTPNSANAVETITMSISNPPTQVQVLAIRDKLNELITALHRP